MATQFFARAQPRHVRTSDPGAAAIRVVRVGAATYDPDFAGAPLSPTHRALMGIGGVGGLLFGGWLGWGHGAWPVIGYGLLFNLIGVMAGNAVGELAEKT